tara:strand:+ start:203 stop:361 length:159 start_codon:yes stop_codon:yes gene_type:complete
MIGEGTEILADEDGNLFKKTTTSTAPPFGSTDSLTYTVTTGPEFLSLVGLAT